MAQGAMPAATNANSHILSLEKKIFRNTKMSTKSLERRSIRSCALLVRGAATVGKVGTIK